MGDPRIATQRRQNKMATAMSKRAEAKLRIGARGASAYEQVCLGKHAYTRQEARREARRLRARKLRDYRCVHCGMYHLTKSAEHW